MTFKNITWNTGPAAERARHNLKLKKALKEGAYKRWKKLLKQKAASRKRQDYINGERLQHLLGWKGSSDLGPKPQAPSFKRHEKDTIK